MIPPVINPIFWTDKPNTTLDWQPKFNNNRDQVPLRNMIRVNLNTYERDFEEDYVKNSEKTSGESLEENSSESLEDSERSEKFHPRSVTGMPMILLCESKMHSLKKRLCLTAYLIRFITLFILFFI